MDVEIVYVFKGQLRKGQRPKIEHEGQKDYGEDQFIFLHGCTPPYKTLKNVD